MIPTISQHLLISSTPTTDHWIPFAEWLYTIVYRLPKWSPWSGCSSHQQRSWSQLSNQGLFLFFCHFGQKRKEKIIIKCLSLTNHWYFFSRRASHHFMLLARMAILKWSLFSSTKDVTSTQQPRFVFVLLFPFSKKWQWENAQEKRRRNTEKWDENKEWVPNNLTTHSSISSTPSPQSTNIPILEWLHTVVYRLSERPSWCDHSSHQQRSWS